MNVLMTLMGLDIGGAETHVVELAIALKNKGVSVSVASSGGVYEELLQKNSIKHYKVPLNNKKIFNIIRSYFKLSKIIQENKIDVVHAHARIPAFICGLLKCSIKFKFITTAHGIFSTSFPFKMLSNWGQRTMVVSEDIKNYLSNNYKIDHEKIKLTINGINTQRFAPDINFSDISQEFEFGEGVIRIVYVSRLDNDQSSVAYFLIEVAHYLDRNSVKPIELVIVGGGEEFGNIESRAGQVNEEAKKRLIIVTNTRTDVNKFIASADICVGVARSILESMSCSKPVIIAGNEGYVGIFDQSKFQQCLDMNFTCRGCPACDCEQLKRDLMFLIENDNKYLGQYSRQIIVDYYSSEKMTKDVLEVYNEVLKRENDILISGYYGYQNSGDDSLLRAIIDDLVNLNSCINIIVLSKSPKKTQREYGVRALHRFRFTKIFKVLKNTRLLISGGGSLLQDSTSTRSLLYYLLIINAAIKRGAKVMLYANGFGPIVKEHNRVIVSAILNKVDCITLRENDSADELKKIGVDRPKIHVTADPVFSLGNLEEDSITEILSDAGVLKGEKYFCISIRDWNGCKRHFEKQIASAADYAFAKYDLLPIFIPMQRNADEGISLRIMSRTIRQCKIVTPNNIGQSLNLVSKAEFVIGMRLHTIIYAAKAGVPVIGIVYDKKVRAMMDYLQQDFCLDINDITKSALQDNINYIMGHKIQISKKLREIADYAHQKSLYTARLAIDLLH